MNLKLKPLGAGATKEPTNLLCEWKSDADPVILEIPEGTTRRLRDAPLATLRFLILNRLLVARVENFGVLDHLGS